MDTNDAVKEDIAKKDNDFKLIYEELKRQYDTLLRIDDSHDLKAGVFLGFIVVIIMSLFQNPPSHLLSSKSGTTPC